MRLSKFLKRKLEKGRVKNVNVEYVKHVEIIWKTCTHPINFLYIFIYILIMLFIGEWRGGLSILISA